MAATPPLSHFPEDLRVLLRGFLQSVNTHKALAPQTILVYGSAARGEFLSGYSNVNLLIMLERITQPVLWEWSRFQKRWAAENIVAPLFLTQEELQRSADAFPLELLDIKAHHVLLEGRDPFPGLRVTTAHVFFQCEQELRGNLLRVRQCYVEGWGRIEAIQALLPLSLTALLACLRGLYRLLGHPSSGNSQAALDDLNAVLNVDPSVFLEVWRLKRGLSAPGKHELPKLLERYLSGLVRLTDRVTGMKQEGRLP